MTRFLVRPRSEWSDRLRRPWCIGSVHFCDNNNVSDLVLQCVTSHSNFQALHYFNMASTALILNKLYFAFDIFQVSGKQIRDIEVPAALFLFVSMVPQVQ